MTFVHRSRAIRFLGVAQPAGTAMMRALRKEVDDRSLALVPELFAPNVVLQTPDGPLEGHAGAVALVQTYNTAFGLGEPIGRSKTIEF